MRIHRIIPITEVEGPGKRFCIWVQGCHKHCMGCWATETWDFNKGIEYSLEQLCTIIDNQSGIEGVTFLGGEPFEQAKELSMLCEFVHKKGLSVLCFSGYTLEELKQKDDIYVDNALKNIDLLIDGGFEIEKFDLSRPWVGSKNQRYIFLSNFYSLADVKKYKNKIEARISTDGKLEINGMGDFNRIEKSFYLQLGKDNVEL